MSRRAVLDHEFVSHIPERVVDGVLYVSLVFAIAVHKCCCGCGQEVITPFTPKDWRMTFDGESVSLWPSIGNRRFDCQSHYYIRRNKAVWLPSFAEISLEPRRPFWRRLIPTRLRAPWR